MNFSHFQKRNKTNLSEPKVRNNINQDTIPSLGSNPLQKLFSIQGLDGGGKTSTYPGTPKGFMGIQVTQNQLKTSAWRDFFQKKIQPKMKFEPKKTIFHHAFVTRLGETRNRKNITVVKDTQKILKNPKTNAPKCQLNCNWKQFSVATWRGVDSKIDWRIAVIGSGRCIYSCIPKRLITISYTKSKSCNNCPYLLEVTLSVSNVFKCIHH